MGADEKATVRDLKAHQAVILPMIPKHGGNIIDTAGDGILAEFSSIVNAVECAVALQKVMAERNALIPIERQMRYRIGVNLGDVIHDDQRVYGDGVNIAARLESIADASCHCNSLTWVSTNLRTSPIPSAFFASILRSNLRASHQRHCPQFQFHV